MKERRYAIDWMRVIAMLAVFIFHCTRFFDTEGWHLKNPEQSIVVFVLTRGLIWPWVMELFFVVSGVAAWYALKSRKGSQYLWERVKRLLIPLYTVGLFILIPPQAYFESVTNGGYDGTFWEMLSLYFGRLPADFLDAFPSVLYDPARLVPFTFSGHLWFLQYLFLISLVTLPLLLYLRSENGNSLIMRVAGWSDRRGGIFLFVIPLVFILICFRSLFGGGRTWTDFLWYTTFFIMGYVLFADERFAKSIKRNGWVCLAFWLIGFFGGLSILVLVLGYDPMQGNGSISLLFICYQIVWSITSWSAVVFVLSIGLKYLNFNNNVLVYANEAVLPFYLLHQTVILCVGWFVIRWGLGIAPKFLIISIASFSLIMVLYELFIKRFDGLRFLFGMRPKKKPSANPDPHLSEISN